MMKLSARILLTVIAAVLPAAALENIRAVAEAVDQHYNHLHTMETQFTETYRGLGLERTETGTLWLEKGGLKKPGKMRWEYRSPEDKLFVSDGKEVWFYVLGDHQARRSEANKLNDLRSPLEFLLGKTQLEKELRGLSFAPDVQPLNAGDVLLRGIPQGFASQISEMLLEVNPQHEIVRIEMQNVDGSVTEYRFSDQKADVRLPAGWFHFKPPAGTETIEGLEE
ncbi:MAG: outer membrane lipoprotein carrier protein LolA [Candidatus Sulfotelmatobacter sp.]